MTAMDDADAWVTRFEPGVSLVEVIREQAQMQGDASLFAEVGGPVITYAKMDDAVQRWAAAYHRAGVRAGDRVVIVMPTSIISNLAWLGCAALGAVAVPTDPRLLQRQVEHVLVTADARCLVVDTLAVRAIEALAGHPALPTVVVAPKMAPQLPSRYRVITLEDFFDDVELLDLPFPRRRDVATLLFTSGTTGSRKAAIVHWAQLHAIALRCMPPDTFTRADTVYGPFPNFHLSGKMLPFAAALGGSTLVIRPSFSGSEFWRDIADHHCTVAMLIGGMANVLMGRQPSDSDRNTPLERVHISPVLPNITAFAERFGVQVATGYGMTEISVPFGSGSWGQISDTRSCGRLLGGYPYIEIRIVDDDDEPVPRGTAGELIVRTAVPWTQTTGYFRQPERTLEALRNGWFHTGDAFREGDGNYYIVDRITDTIRRRGENLSSADIEGAVEEHPAISACAAVGVDVGAGDQEIKIVVVARDGAQVDPVILVEFLRGRLPEFMVPRYIEVVESLPRVESTQRIQKAALKTAGVTEATFDRLSAS